MSKKTILSWLQLILSTIGTCIAGAVFFADRAKVDLPCTSGGGCTLVAASHWSHVGSLPVSLLGLAGYVLLAMLSVMKLTADSDNFANRVAWIMFIITLGGNAYSWYLQYVAAVNIGAFCIWCRASAITMTLLFAASLADCMVRSRYGNPAT